MLSEIFYFSLQHFYMLNRMNIWMGKRGGVSGDAALPLL